jgi:hypothetical protein
MDDRSALDEVLDRRATSQRWMESSFYHEWAEVIQSYRCERDPERNEEGALDASITSFGTPLTLSYVQRTVSRITAQLPNIKFVARDPAAAELVSRTLMYQWDKGGIQRKQKRHVRQAVLFGWSVRAWYWAVEEFTRRRRIDPAVAIGQFVNGDPSGVHLIEDTYNVRLSDDFGGLSPDVNGVLAGLYASHGKGGLIPVEYNYVSYAGPKAEFVSVADCFPEPGFEEIQTSNWFIVERRRNRADIHRIMRAFPEFRAGLAKLLEEFPHGTKRQIGSQNSSLNFRTHMQRAYGGRNLYPDESHYSDRTHYWTIIEEHAPGPNGHLRMVGEDKILIGSIPYPYDLDGKIAFTECVFIDDMMGGVGDSIPRFMRGLQKLHERQTLTRHELIYNVSRPLVGTMSREFYDDPSKLKRGHGFRLVYMRSPQDIWVQGEQAALAAAAANMSDEGSIMRAVQMLTGETNMSMSANVDPQQARTATGARIMAYIGDLLSNDQVMMFTESSLKPDATVMYLLNRSEMSDPVTFDVSEYNRRFAAVEDPLREQWMSVEPRDFQIDGEVMVEVGSTLADDDERKMQQAMTLWNIGAGRPDLFNQQKLRDALLVNLGKARELPEWVAPPPPPPVPPPAVRPSLNISARLEDTPPEMQELVLQAAGVVPPPASPERSAMLGGGTPPGAPPPPPGMPSPPKIDVPGGESATEYLRGPGMLDASRAGGG